VDANQSLEDDITLVRRAPKDVPDLFLANLVAQAYTPVQQAFLVRPHLIIHYWSANISLVLSSPFIVCS